MTESLVCNIRRKGQQPKISEPRISSHWAPNKIPGKAGVSVEMAEARGRFHSPGLDEREAGMGCLPVGRSVPGDGDL